MMPRRLRRSLLDVIPPARQLWLTRQVLRIGGGERRLAGDTAIVREGDYRVRARVTGFTTPQSVREENLELVTGALERAGLPYFCVPTGRIRSTVAVPAEHRDEFLQLLRTDPGLGEACTRRLVHGRPPRLGRARAERHPRLVVRVWQPVTDPYGNWVIGHEYGCDVEFWRRVGDELVGPRARTATSVAPADDTATEAPAWVFNPHLPDSPPVPSRRTRAAFAGTPVGHVSFPIDAVYTWVDGTDPDWLRRKAAALDDYSGQSLHEVATNESRYLSRDELRYSMRSLAYFAPWIRRIYLVTDDQLPAWLDPHDPMVTVVSHRELFGDTGRLPTFNSHAIESRLHRLPGLAEHFLYFNDDVFLGRPVPPSVFFLANGIARFFPSPASVDLGPATLRDAPVDAAAKQNRQYLLRRFGRTITQKMRHVPHALRRSVLEEIESSLPEAVGATASHQFRHPDDLSIVSSLHHYWSFLSGTSVPGRITYAYGDIAHPSTAVKLASMLARRPYEVFCLNDVDSSDATALEQNRLLAGFLPSYFPFRAPFELTDEQVALRSRLTATERMRTAGVPPASLRLGGPGAPAHAADPERLRPLSRAG